MHGLKRKNWLEIGAMTLIFFLAVFLTYRTTILTRMGLPNMTAQAEADGKSFYALSSGDHIEQTFRYPSDELLSAGIQISLDEDALNDLAQGDKREMPGALRLEVRDEEGKPLMSADYDVYALKDGQNLLASFPGTQTGWTGRKLCIALDAETIHPEIGLEIGYTEKEIKGAKLKINGESRDFTLNIQTADHQFFYWRAWAAFGAVLVYLLLLGTYLGLSVFCFRPERVFLFAGSLLAALYLLLLPPMSVPDEGAHLKEAYHYANMIMGKEQAKDGYVVMDKADFNAMRVFEATPSLSEYDDLKESVFQAGRETGTKEVKRYDTWASPVTYLPGIAGLMIGRLLGLNGFLVIYMGRICSILFYLFTMYWFIRWMPFGKAAAFVMAILPMTIQQCCSYSYDSVVIECAFLYMAMLFGLLYKKQEIKKWQIAAYALFMVILSISKGGAYMPLCLLTMLIPADRLKGKKRKWLFVGLMAAVAISAFLSSTLSYALYVASPTEEQMAESYLSSGAYGMAGLLADPMNFILLSARTLLGSGDGFLETMLGMQLSWLNVFVSRIVIYGMLFLMVLSILQVEGQSGWTGFHVTRGQKVSYLTVFSLSVAMVFASMYMSWTPKNSISIAGIQGRYFLPALPAFLLLFQSKNIVLKKDMDKKIIFIAVCLQCLAIYGILISLERVL